MFIKLRTKLIEDCAEDIRVFIIFIYNGQWSYCVVYAFIYRSVVELYTDILYCKKILCLAQEFLAFFFSNNKHVDFVMHEKFPGQVL